MRGTPVVKTLPSNAWGTGSIPGQRTKIPCAALQKKKKSVIQRYCKNSVDFKNGPHQKKSLKYKRKRISGHTA